MIYFTTSAILILTVFAFFLFGAHGSFGRVQWFLRVVVALPLLASGVLHFTRTALLATIVPPFFPHRSLLVLVSGVMELAGAAGLLLPAVTRAASVCLALLMVATFFPRMCMQPISSWAACTCPACRFGQRCRWSISCCC
jgi:hypothetical protein